MGEVQGGYGAVVKLATLAALVLLGSEVAARRGAGTVLAALMVGMVGFVPSPASGLLATCAGLAVLALQREGKVPGRSGAISVACALLSITGSLGVALAPWILPSRLG